MAESKDKRTSSQMGMPPAKDPLNSTSGLQMMEVATGLRGGSAKEVFQKTAERVFSLMLNEQIDYICIKKSKAGKITKIQAH